MMNETNESTRPTAPRNNPFLGSHYFLRGLKQLFRPGLKRYVWLPLFINSLLFTGLFALGWHGLHVLEGWLTHLLPHWLTWLTWLLWPLFWLASVLISYYCFSILANLLGAPFNGLLAAQVHFQLSGKTLPAPNGWGETFAELPKILQRQGQWLGYYCPRALLALLLFFIPAVQIVAPFVWFALNAWMLAIQYLDYSQDNHHYALRNLIRLSRRSPLLILGFGTAAVFALLIPVLNFFVMPAAVIGASELWYQELRENALFYEREL